MGLKSKFLIEFYNKQKEIEMNHCFKYMKNYVGSVEILKDDKLHQCYF